MKQIFTIIFFLTFFSWVNAQRSPASVGSARTSGSFGGSSSSATSSFSGSRPGGSSIGTGSSVSSANYSDSYQHRVFERRGYNSEMNYYRSDNNQLSVPFRGSVVMSFNETDPQARMLWKEITHSETYFKRETLMPLHVEPARCERYVRTEVALHIIDKEVKPFSTASFQKITSTPIYNFESKPSTVENETGGELPVSSGGFQPNKFEPVTSSANNEVIFQKDLSFIYNMFFIMHADAFCLNARERILSKKSPTLEEIESFFVTNAHCFNRQRIIRNILNYSGLFR